MIRSFVKVAPYIQGKTKIPLHEAVLVYFYVLHLVMERSSHRRWSVKSNIFKNFVIFTGKLCWNNFIKKRFQLRLILGKFPPGQFPPIKLPPGESPPGEIPPVNSPSGEFQP